MRSCSCLGLIMILVSCWVSPLSATTYTVDDDGPADFTSIGDALDAAVAGDDILVMAGTYYENISMKTGVSVLGAGKDVTHIIGAGAGHVVDAYYVSECKIEGFTISNSSGNYYAIRIVGGSPLIRDNRIADNVRGVTAYNDTTATIDQNVFQDNGDPDNGIVEFAISCIHASCLISNNLVVGNLDFGIYLASWESDSYPQVFNNTIADNVAGEGIWCYGAGSFPTLTDNIVAGNSLGINASHDAVPVISYNDVWNNSYTDYDGTATPGSGDISADPLFAGAGDYHITKGSPCVDTGKDTGVVEDIDGDGRPQGASFDMGADEFVPGCFILTVM